MYVTVHDKEKNTEDVFFIDYVFIRTSSMHLTVHNKERNIDTVIFIDGEGVRVFYVSK